MRLAAMATLAAALAFVHPLAARVDAQEGSALAAPLRTIRTAVLAGDARGFLQCFELDQPTFVSVSPLERGGFLGPGPLDAFLRRLLADRVSVSFDVLDVPDVPGDASRAFVKAVWTKLSRYHLMKAQA